QQPMFYAAVAFASGVITSSLTGTPMGWAVAVTICIVGTLGLAAWRSASALVLAFSACFALGGLLGPLEGSTDPADADLSPYLYREAVIVAHITRTTLPRARDAGEVQVLDVETEEIDGKALLAGVRLYLFTADPDPEETDYNADPSPPARP